MNFTNFDYLAMTMALLAARESAKKHGEVPVGALVARGEEFIALAANQKEQEKCATRHAEIVVTEAASTILGCWRLIDCTLYVTLEPCIMCAGAIIQARYKRVVFGANDPTAGALGSFCNILALPGLNHYPIIEKGLLEEECAKELKDFFLARRQLHPAKKYVRWP